MLMSLEPMSEWDPVMNDMTFLWTHAERASIFQAYNISVSGLHPWKLSDPQNARALPVRMSEADPTLRSLLHMVFDGKLS